MVAVQVRPLDDIENYYRTWSENKPVFCGKVIGNVRHEQSIRGPKTKCFLKLTSIENKDDEIFNVSGRVLVRFFSQVDVKERDEICVAGKWGRVFDFGKHGQFSYRDHLRRQGVNVVVNVSKQDALRIVARHGPGIINHIRERIKEKCRMFLSEPVSALVQAVIIGERSGICKDVYTMFQRTGTAHLLAISGFHTGIVIGILFLIAGFFAPRLKNRIGIVIIGIWAFAALTVWRVSIVRSAVMAFIFLCSFLFERKNDALNTLALAGFILTGINPQVIFTIGFLLSFCAVAAIILFFPAIDKAGANYLGLKREGFRRSLWACLSVSLAAWAGTVGYVVYFFGGISMIAVLSNMLLVPLMGCVVCLGLLFLVTPSALPWVFQCVVLCLELSWGIMFALIKAFSNTPFAYFHFPKLPFWCLCAYYLMIIFIFYIKKDEFLY